METTPDLARDFLDFSRTKLMDEFWPRLRTTVESLTEEQVWWRPNESCNSIGNLLLHLSGNVRQWIITSFRGTEDARRRPLEFSRREAVPTRELLDLLGATLQETSAVLSSLTAGDLDATYSIQGYQVTGLDAIYHVVEHFGMHYGQILYIAKMLQSRDLGFYQHLDATGRA